MQIDRPIATALILFIILLLVFFLVVPEYKTFGKLQEELGEKKAEFNAQFDYYNAIANTYQQLQGRKDDIKKIDDALPQDPALGRVIYFLQQTAKGSGMMVKNLFLSKSSSNSAKSNEGNSVKDIIFSINASGDYASLEKFIISLEKSSRIFEITNISFGSSTSSSASSQTSVSASIPASPSVPAAPASLQTQFQTQQIYSFNLQIKTRTY
jgi:Tfp pilus assembly protein PilO